MSNSTLLELDGIDFSDSASRGISSTLKPIATGALRRDVNGTLVDLTLPQFRKYQLDVSCHDQEVPGFLGVWRGKLVHVTVVPGLGLDNTAGPISFDALVDTWSVEQPDEWEFLKTWSLSLLQV